MKKLLLSIFAAASLAASAQTITQSDLNWTIGNEWYMNQTTGMSISSFTSSGTGVNWDLTGYEGTVLRDTIKAVTPTWPTAAVAIESNVISRANYEIDGSDYAMKTFNVLGNDLSMTGNLSIGLDHTSASSWSPVTSTINPLAPLDPPLATTLTGSVLATGTVELSYGTYDALLVEETFVLTGYVDMTFYYWETKEFGRIATIVDGNLLVMNQNNFNPIIDVSTQEVSTTELNIFPNPATDNFTVSAEGLENVTVFDAIGNLVVNQNVNTSNYQVNTAGLNAGIYFVTATANGTTSTSRVVVK